MIKMRPFTTRIVCEQYPEMIPDIIFVTWCGCDNGFNHVQFSKNSVVSLVFIPWLARLPTSQPVFQRIYFS